MKTTVKTTMKTLSLVLGLGLVTIACNDQDEVAPNQEQAITYDEAADEIATTLATDITGLAADLSVLSTDAENARMASDAKMSACGVSYDTTFTRTYNGQYVTSASTVSYQYELSCKSSSGGAPALTYSFAAEGNRNSIRLASQGTSDGSLAASGLEASSTVYQLNGLFERTSEVTQKTQEQKTFNSESDVTLTELVINKETLKIESGAAAFSLHGESTGGGTFDYTSSIVFNGDETATITLNSAEVYQVNLATGEVTK